MVTTLLLALGLMFVLEGILPFVAPRLWRDTFARITQLTDGQLRFMGLASLVGGLCLILIVK